MIISTGLTIHLRYGRLVPGALDVHVHNQINLVAQSRPISWRKALINASPGATLQSSIFKFLLATFYRWTIWLFFFIPSHRGLDHCQKHFLQRVAPSKRGSQVSLEQQL